MRHLICMTLVLGFLLLTGCGSSDSIRPAPQEIAVDEVHPSARSIYSDPVFGVRCGIPLKCNDVVVIDCGSATDGPKNYYNNLTGEVIMFCGGACLAPQAGDPKSCGACPPLEWRCT